MTTTAGSVRRDIKPENILIDQDGDVKIADFGLAKLVGDPDAGGVQLTQTRQVLGTPHYMAPEQIERPAVVDHRADIFSLGVVFYEMLTGQLPLGRFRPPSEHSEASPHLDPVVLRSLEREPDRRAQRYRRRGRHDVRPLVAAILLGLGVLAVFLTLFTVETAWTFLAMPLLADVLIAGLLEAVLPVASEEVGAWVWGGLSLADLAVLVWLVRRVRRSGKWQQ